MNNFEFYTKATPTKDTSPVNIINQRNKFCSAMFLEQQQQKLSWNDRSDQNPFKYIYNNFN